MKKILLPLASLALLAASCSPTSGDSYQRQPFYEQNLIIDYTNPDAVATVSSAWYSSLLNWTQNTADLRVSDLVIDGQKVSFETKSMPVTFVSVKDPNSEFYAQQGEFSSRTPENIATGATVCNLNAFFTSGVYNVVGLNVPGFNNTVVTNPRLVMSYDLNDRYTVKTFWNECYYVGQTSVSGASGNYTSKSTIYRVQIDFAKNLAKVVVYYPEFSEKNNLHEDMPRAFVMEDVPVVMGHSDYSLKAEEPKTKIMVNNEGVGKLEDPGKYQIKDFELRITSSDLTDANIAFTVDGNSVVFNGCSIVKNRQQ